MQPNLAEMFLEEADELLAEIEAAALGLNGLAGGNGVTGNGAGSDEAVNRIFRAFHTIKGSGSMFGFDEVARFTHHVETLLDRVRENTVPVTEELTDIVLESADQIKSLLRAAQGGEPGDPALQEALLSRVREISNPSGIVREQMAVGSPSSAFARVWSIRFRPDPLLLSRGCKPTLLFRDLKSLGDCVIEGHTDALPPLAELDPERCYLWWTIRLTPAAGLSLDADAIREVFMFVEEGADLHIEAAEEIGKVEVRNALTAGVQPAASAKMGAVSDTTQKAAEVVQENQTQTREATVRVPASRLDRLVNLVGELVMNQSRLATASARLQSAELAAPVEEIERLVAELRDDVLQIRMMPIGTIFSRFRRLVRDLSLQLGKEIELVTEGEDTELDKSILDALGEPLVHLLRNSIDHGIESVEDRLAKGKPRRGTIRLTATHRGSDVVVSIEDDGKGMDRAIIRAKAVAKQLIAAEANLSDKEILNLILLPGFSTAESVTSLSGRGVGMDVVKRYIDALRGTVSIASEFGAGACVSLTLPLTLAIIDGLLVEAGDSQYIVPMAAVTENVELPRSDRARSNGRNLVAVRGELIPYIDLRQAFHIPGTGPAISKIVLVRHQDQRIGVVVDRVMGTHQTVIQALGHFFRNIEVISGSTVMGDGRVALILDIAGIVRLADRQCRERTPLSGLVAAAA